MLLIDHIPVGLVNVQFKICKSCAVPENVHTHLMDGQYVDTLRRPCYDMALKQQRKADEMATNDTKMD